MGFASLYPSYGLLQTLHIGSYDDEGPTLASFTTRLCLRRG